MELEEIGRQAHAINGRNGWDVFTPSMFPEKGDFIAKERTHFLLAHMALVHSEVSEATEAVRHYDKDNFVEELADTIIRVTSIAWGLELHLEEAIKAKLEKNSMRGLHHGGKAM